MSYLYANYKEILTSQTLVSLEDVDPKLMTLQVKIEGSQFHASLTGDVARAIGEIQQIIYRIAAEYLHQSKNINSLSGEEKEVFTVIIEVKPGCSELSVNFTEIISTIFQSMVGKMLEYQINLFLGGLAAYLAGRIGSDIYKTIKENETAQKKLDVEVAKEEIASKERISVVEMLAPVRNGYDGVPDKIAKSAKKADSVKVGDHIYTSEDIQKLNARAPRTSIEPEVTEGVFVVNGFSNQDDKAFKVELKDASTGEKINAFYEPNSVLASQQMTFNKFASELAGKKINCVLYTKNTKTTSTTILTDWELVDEMLDRRNQEE